MANHACHMCTIYMQILVSSMINSHLCSDVTHLRTCISSLVYPPPPVLPPGGAARCLAPWSDESSCSSDPSGRRTWGRASFLPPGGAVISLGAGDGVFLKASALDVFFLIASALDEESSQVNEGLNLCLTI